ncbi:MAG: hypothetical protein ACRYFS_24440 [Janthinobacterium lividum]
MKNSIRYDLPFQECLLRFTNDQLEPESNPDESGPSLDQEQAQNQSFKMLVDIIDIYAGKYHAAQMQKHKEAKARRKADARK